MEARKQRKTYKEVVRPALPLLSPRNALCLTCRVCPLYHRQDGDLALMSCLAFALGALEVWSAVSKSKDLSTELGED